MSTVGSTSSIFNTGSSTAQSGGQVSGSNSEISATDFYKLIAAQLANQDPQNATDTNQMVQSMMSISSYQAVQTQTTAINSLTMNSTATNLLGKTVTVNVPATATAEAQTVTGAVTDAHFYSNGATVTVNGKEYSLGDVTAISAPTSGTNNPPSGN